MKSFLTNTSRAMIALLLFTGLTLGSVNQADARQNILNNGDFSSGLESWSTFIADFAGVSANVAVVDGEATITEISGAGGEVWWIQLNQILSQSQIDALTVGQAYKIQFDARSNAEGRQLRSFFGEEGGGFAAQNVFDISLSTEMQTYETIFTLTAKYPEMKLGFEAGLSNDDVIVDNVSLTPTDETPPPPGGLSLPVTFNDPDIDYGLFDFEGASSSIVTDPTDPSNLVVRTVKPEGVAFFAGTTVGEPDGFSTPIPFTPDETTMSVRVWSPVAGIPVRAKVEDSNDPTISVETEATVTVAEEWQLLVFDFANQAGGTAPINFANNYNKFTIFFDFTPPGPTEVERVYFWDDVAFGGEGVIVPPPTPVGFVIANNIGGEPVGSGEMFLAAGPNNVENPNIEYRLFYARTADNVENPITEANEYEFGTTEGDGNGVGPFGFNISGLDPGTSYTFWLHQYNTSTELFSEPAVATEVSGGTGTSVEEPGEMVRDFQLSQNYPNPFNPTTVIEFAIPEAAQVSLEVFSINGQRVATLVNGSLQAGQHSVSFDASNLSSGIYLYRLQAGNTTLMRQMTLVK
ncbi:MAG: T9SS type A sorting domain-containing protein [Candidatus Cyclonatronum sp.]|uniref:T9SS type A sorting domain-containing protein n=1 Tax=Cyclonatronum sp. TaxID=3024185 RepID=UPI0025BBA361|nr:T9SS type A sorting domain-containing protein [Cyclonatronum sp.]MCH8487610.1 T9SS type A sorting domain-containing protein [Cyclonatronum sp.]